MKPTLQFRVQKRTNWISDSRTHIVYALQQMFIGNDEEEAWTEWVDVPVVDEDGKPASYP